MLNVSTKKRTLIFSILLASCIMSSLIQTALSTALTPIMQHFNVPASTAQWLSSGYSLAMGVMLLASAYCIRNFKNKPLYIFFMGTFCTGLLLCCVASNFYILLFGRILQAIGCAVLMSLAQVVILTMYPKEKQGTIMGFYGLAVCAAPVFAPTLSGIIVDLFGWRMIFVLSLIICAFLWIFGGIFICNVTENKASSFDTLSFVYCSVGFVGFVFGLGNVTSSSSIIINAILPMSIGALFLTLFYKRQMGLSTPLLNVKLFKNKQFLCSVILSMLLYASMMAVSTLLPLYAQSTRGLSATVSGLITMPGSLLTALASPIAGKLFDKIGVKKLFVLGSSTLALGHLMFCTLSMNTPVMMICIYFVMRQFGVALLMMPITTWGLTTLDKIDMPDGTSLISSLRTIAGSIGAAVFVSVSSAINTANAPMLGYQIAFTCICVLSIFILLICVFKVKDAAKKAT